MLASVDSILVTGGAGFVGSWLVRELLEQTEAARVVVLDNLVNGRREFLPESERLALREVDLRDEEAVNSLVDEVRPEAVFHLAALHFIPYCNAHPSEAVAVNILGTQHLLEACRRYLPATLVAASTAAVYPIREGANAEDSPLGPTDIYGLTKWMNERQVEQFAAAGRTRCGIARLFNVFGPHETNPHVIPDILDQIRRGRDALALGNVKPRRDYIHVTDVARALVAIADRNEHACRAYNVGTGREHSVEEIVACLARISGRPLRSPWTPSVRAADRMHLLCDTRRARDEIGWRPRHTLESGLADLWRTLDEPAAELAVPAIQER